MIETMDEVLDRLKADFDAHRMEWIEDGHEGEWALLGPKGLQGFHRTYDAAVRAAVEAFGPERFLVQEVRREDRVESVQHLFLGGTWAATGA